MNKILKKISGVIFLFLLAFIMILGIFLPDSLVSVSERRKLAQLPDFSIDALFDDDFSDTLETYFLDQFPGRDFFRTLKAEVDTTLLGKTDSNDYVKIEENLFQIRTTYDEKQLLQAANKFESIANTYFLDSNVYYGIIPDKNYFVPSLPQYDYNQVEETLNDTFVSGKQISLWDTVTLEDYYRTDLHAKQESLLPLANALLNGMGKDTAANTMDSYTVQLATDSFLGGYAANSAYSVSAEPLYYLENSALQNCSVYDYELQKTTPVYQTDKLGAMDDYDLFLGGARALLTMENPLQTNEETLLVFRDSFGSSITPLLLDSYSKITLVDLRYVSADYALTLLENSNNGDYTDVLFLYQVQLLYNSNSMK